MQGQDDIDETGQKRHQHEKNHDRAVRREQLREMLRRQESPGIVRQRLLDTHQQGFDESPQQHHQRDNHVHDADPAVVQAGEPVTPQPRPAARDRQQHDHGEYAQHHDAGRRRRNGAVKGQRIEAQTAPHQGCVSAWYFAMTRSNSPASKPE